MTKKSILAFVVSLLLLAPAAFAQTKVKGHTRKDGTYVEPHTRTKPNKTENDNWSTKGNTNPNTGKPGTKTPRK